MDLTDPEREKEARLLIPAWALGRGEVPVEVLQNGD